MKCYNECVPEGKYGKDTRNAIAYFDKSEIDILREALGEYCEKYKRRKKAKKLLYDFDRTFLV